MRAGTATRPIRAHLFGNWYLAGDFNPAPAVPVWPFLEWVLFLFTGVSVQAARGLAVAFFFANLVLSYLLLRARGPRWAALLAVTLLVTSPFLYCFSRLAILEPMLTALTLAALNLAVRLPRDAPAGVGLGVHWRAVHADDADQDDGGFSAAGAGLGDGACRCGGRRKAAAMRCVAAASGSFLRLVWRRGWRWLLRAGLLADYRYLFFVNKYPKPQEFYWPLVSFWWSFHGGLWVDRILIPLAGLLVLGAALAWAQSRGRAKLLLDPVFGASRAGGGRLHPFHDVPEPSAAALFRGGGFLCFFVVAQGLAMLRVAGNGAFAAGRAADSHSAGAAGRFAGCGAAVAAAASTRYGR